MFHWELKDNSEDKHRKKCEMQKRWWSSLVQTDIRSKIIIITIFETHLDTCGTKHPETE